MPQSHTVYVKLLDEGTDVWRPVLARHLGTDVYQLPSSQDDRGEVWEFPPGSLVRCEMRTLSDGSVRVASAAVDFPGDSPRILVPIDRITDFCRRWKVAELALFGSVLDEDFRPDSDVDVLVTFEPAASWSLWDVLRAREELASLFGRPVDLVDRPALEKHHNPWLRHSILSNARVIYRAA